MSNIQFADVHGADFYPLGRRSGQSQVFFWGGTRPTPPSHASVVHTFEAVAGSWGSVRGELTFEGGFL